MCLGNGGLLNSKSQAVDGKYNKNKNYYHRLGTSWWLTDEEAENHKCIHFPT